VKVAQGKYVAEDAKGFHSDPIANIDVLLNGNSKVATVAELDSLNDVAKLKVEQKNSTALLKTVISQTKVRTNDISACFAGIVWCLQFLFGLRRLQGRITSL
jgi:hypothetical protein